VGLSRELPRQISYSIPGLPESWPEVYNISALPLPEHDELRDLVDVGGTLLVGAQNVMIRLEDLPRVVQGGLDASAAEPIAGAPGLASRYGMTTLSTQGESRAAWISHHGIYMTNTQVYDRISDDLLWNSGFTDAAGTAIAALETQDKSNWVLYWDDKYQVLIFAFSSTDGGTNDRFYLAHMAREHLKSNGQPKWTGPHRGEINSIAGGNVGNQRRLYIGDPADGKVFLEDRSTASDASNQEDASGTITTTITGPRVYGDSEYSVLDAFLRHTDFGSGQTCSVAVTTGRDNPATSQTRTQSSVSLASQLETQFDVSRGGHYSEAKITHTGTGLGAWTMLRMNTRRLGPPGRVRVA
jgi:hypothetical protein